MPNGTGFDVTGTHTYSGADLGPQTLAIHICDVGGGNDWKLERVLPSIKFTVPLGWTCGPKLEIVTANLELERPVQ